MGYLHAQLCASFAWLGFNHLVWTKTGEKQVQNLPVPYQQHFTGLKRERVS